MISYTCLYTISYICLIFFFFLCLPLLFFFFFFLNDPAPPEISPLPLHAALPISEHLGPDRVPAAAVAPDLGGMQNGHGDLLPADGVHLLADDGVDAVEHALAQDRKSTRLNSSHLVISYAVFCLKKKKKNTNTMFIGWLEHQGTERTWLYYQLVCRAPQAAQRPLPCATHKP